MNTLIFVKYVKTFKIYYSKNTQHATYPLNNFSSVWWSINYRPPCHIANL